ncbi:MAG: hypothetical protein F6K58_12140 [Symploca sp. SIO2E9]|nr:hypothetical protein [Symploca sp. SIO2E9]
MRRCGDAETRRRGDAETRRRGDAETRRHGDAETRRRGDAEMRRIKILRNFRSPTLDKDTFVRGGRMKG